MTDTQKQALKTEASKRGWETRRRNQTSAKEADAIVNGDDVEAAPTQYTTALVGGASWLLPKYVPFVRETLRSLKEELGTAMVIHDDCGMPERLQNGALGKRQGISKCVRLALQTVDVHELQVAQNRAANETHAELNTRMLRTFEPDCVLIFGSSRSPGSKDLGVQAKAMFGKDFPVFDLTKRLEAWKPEDSRIPSADVPEFDAPAATLGS